MENVLSGSTFNVTRGAFLTQQLVSKAYGILIYLQMMNRNLLARADLHAVEHYLNKEWKVEWGNWNTPMIDEIQY